MNYVVLDYAGKNLLDELLLEIQGNHLLSTHGQGLHLNRIPVLMLVSIAKEALYCG